MRLQGVGRERSVPGSWVGVGRREEAGRTIPLIFALQCLELPGLWRARCLLLIQQGQSVNALLHHSNLCFCLEISMESVLDGAEEGTE